MHVLQGERQMARDNRTLGKFHLIGLPPAPRGMPQIEVAFDIDANGIVNVSAKDTATGREQKITISGSSGLVKADVERMVKEAEAHAAEDKTRRELVDARNQADSLAYQVEKTLDEHRDRVNAGDRSRIESAIAEVRRAAQGDDLEALRTTMAELQRASHALAAALYERGRGADGPTASGGANVKDAEVVDAEYAETQ